jgi:hypothetical protein
MPFWVHLLKSQKSVAFGSSECIAQTDVWPGWEFSEATFVAEVCGEIDASSIFVATESVCCARRHGVTKAMMIEKMILDCITILLYLLKMYT